MPDVVRVALLILTPRTASLTSYTLGPRSAMLGTGLQYLDYLEAGGIFDDLPGA